MNIYILGPGAAGKTTVGQIVADKLKYKFIDLDEMYLSTIGDIGDEIKQVGYESYAYKNIELYRKIKEDNQDNLVFILSSGFMTYDESIHSNIKSIQDDINNHEFSIMLMPSSDKQKCIDVIVKRQMDRKFTSNDYSKHRKVISERFDIYKDLGKYQIFSMDKPEEISKIILDRLFNDERERWNNFFDKLKDDHPLASKFPDESLVEYLEKSIIKPNNVLEIGGGNGRNSVYIAKLGLLVDTIDISDDAIRKTINLAKENDVKINAERISFFEFSSENKYDLIYDAGLFHHVFPHRRSDYIDKVFDGLKVGGVLGLIAFNEKMGTTANDEEIFKQRNMEGGISYPLEKLKQIFTNKFELMSYRPMKNCKSEDKVFGYDFVSA